MTASREQALKRLKILKSKRQMWKDSIAANVRRYGNLYEREVGLAVTYLREVDKGIASLEDMVGEDTAYNPFHGGLE